MIGRLRPPRAILVSGSGGREIEVAIALQVRIRPHDKAQVLR